MSMQRRLALSFLFILALFAINQTVYLVANARRSDVVESRRRSLARRIALLSVEHDIDNLKRQVQLQSQVASVSSMGGLRQPEIAAFSQDIENVKLEIKSLEDLSEGATRVEVAKLRTDFEQLGASWLIFYRNAGTNQTTAITELVTRGEPLSDEILRQLPVLKEQERQRAEAAGQRFYEVNRVAAQITLGLFIVSAALGSVVAYRLSRHITQGLNALETGAALVGSGDLEQRIPVTSSDELGHLASSFNTMADSLLAAQNHLKKTNEALDAARQQSDAANAAKSTFLANMSHELRTPLNAIIGFSEVLADKTFGDINKRQERYVNNILTSGRHLLQLINDILDLAKVEAGRTELDLAQFDAAEAIRVVETVTRPLALKKQQKLEVSILEPLPMLDADPAKFKQIMYNLLSNAIKYTPDGGSVTVTALTREVAGMPKQEPDSKSGDRCLLVSVRDTGVGIKPEDRERVFGEFEQLDDSYARQQQGTGLGLALTRRFVEMHGGRIWVESDGPGHGSTFLFTLPVAGQMANEEPAPASAHSPSNGTLPTDTSALPAFGEPRPGRTVLVIEDDPAAAELLTYYLSEAGYAVVTAKTASESVTAAQTAKPYAITLDLAMQGEDGWMVLERLKSDPLTSSIPVVIVSITEDRQLGLAFGATDFLVKPVDRNRLVEAVKHAGASQRASSVLLIDDQPETVDLLADVLESRGFGVLKAYSGEQGIDLAVERTPDVIVLDLMMPGVTGFDVLNRLHEHPQACLIPILVFTAKELSREDREQLNSQVRAVISKSAKDDLLRQLEKPNALVVA